MEINIVFFDNLLDPDELNSELKHGSKIISYEPCFVYGLKLKYAASKKAYIPFKQGKTFYSSYYSLAFGTRYKIELNELDYELLKMRYLSTDVFKIGNLETTGIKFKSVDEFVKLNFETTTKAKCIAFIANDTEYTRNVYRDRRMGVHLNKRFLLVYKLR